MAARASIVAEGGYHVFILICSARHSKGWRVFLFLFLAAVLAVAMFAMVDHGWIMLGDDALQARNCLKNYGVWKTYQEPTGAVHLLCQYPGQNKIYDVILKWIDGKSQEATAMSHKDGAWSAVQKWLLPRADSFSCLRQMEFVINFQSPAVLPKRERVVPLAIFLFRPGKLMPSTGITPPNIPYRINPNGALSNRKNNPKWFVSVTLYVSLCDQFSINDCSIWALNLLREGHDTLA